MTIPDFQSMLLPLLQACADGKEHSKQQVLPLLAKHFDLTNDELVIKLPSGKQGMFNNRVGWARTYLKQAGILEYVQRGVFRITPRGLQVLSENPESMNIKSLKRFPEFEVFNCGKSGEKIKAAKTVAVSAETPDELIANGYTQLRETLAMDLLGRIKTISPTRLRAWSSNCC
jgi:restriction system protein